MPSPIVLTAFGTTSHARKTYEVMDRIIRKEFSGHEIYWAFSSRMVRDRLIKKKTFEIKHPHEVLQALSDKGHVWAVVQSLHLLCGHEFYRLLDEVQTVSIRSSIGLPLLSSPEDYQNLAKTLAFEKVWQKEEAVVLVGHGTDHSSWSAYLALETVCREVYGPRIFVGVLEGRPSQKEVLQKVIQTKIQRIRLIPLMLVAGVHFYEDLTEGEDSWRAAFEAVGLEVQVEPQGIGVRSEVIQIFVDHIRAALDIIPAADNRYSQNVSGRLPVIDPSRQVSGIG